MREFEEFGVDQGREPRRRATTTTRPSGRSSGRPTELARYGVGGRNLRVFRTSADREAALLQQILGPALRSRNPERRKEAIETLENLAAVASHLKHLLLIRDLRKIAADSLVAAVDLASASATSPTSRSRGSFQGHHTAAGRRRGAGLRRARAGGAGAAAGRRLVVAAEARGFILGAALARELGVGFVPARKPGKLPHETVSAEYMLEYGSRRARAARRRARPRRAGPRPRRPPRHGRHGAGAVRPGRASGRGGGGRGFLIELAFLSGRERLAELDFHALVTYDRG